MPTQRSHQRVDSWHRRTSGNRYDRILSPYRARLRGILAPLVAREQQALLRIQAACVRPWLDPVFAYSTHLGTHTFFMVALPALFWFGHADIGRGLVLILAAGVYVSSFFKDLLCLPRPLAPPVRRLTFSNSSVHLEYGFPSTHTTNALSVALFFATVLYPWFAAQAGTIEATVLASALVAYTVLVCFGRLYCGMHGLVDVFSGAAIAIGLWWSWLVYWPGIEAWILTGSSVLVPAAIVAICIFLISIPPDPVDPCPCFDDSVAFVGVVTGALPATWHLSTNLGYSGAQVPYRYHETGMLHTLAMFGFGTGCIFLWRLVAKRILQRALPPLYTMIRAPYRRFYHSAAIYQEYPRQTKLRRVPSALQIVPSDLLSVGGDGDGGAVLGQGSKHARRRAGSTKARRDGLASATTTDDDTYDDGTAAAAHHEWLVPKLRYDIDIVTRLIVYTGIGWLVAAQVPLWACQLGINSSCVYQP